MKRIKQDVKNKCVVDRRERQQNSNGSIVAGRNSIIFAF